MMRLSKVTVVLTGLLSAAGVDAQEGAGSPPEPPAVVEKEPQVAAPAAAPPRLPPVSSPAEPAASPPDLLTLLRPDLVGFMKITYGYVLPPRTQTLVGSNSGFRIPHALIGVSVQPADTVFAVVTVEGGAPVRSAEDPLTGQRVVSLRDAFVEWRVSPAFRLRAGQYKAPFNAEWLEPEDTLPFISRSIVTQGLVPPEGSVVRGINLDRQLGIQASSQRIGGLIGVQYALALVNGNGANPLNNDNNALAPIGRLAFSAGKFVQIGVNGYMNALTRGSQPSMVENQIGFGGDLAVHVGGLSAFGMYVARNAQSEGPGQSTRRSRGWIGSVRYTFESTGLDAGVRYARYDPDEQAAGDRLQEGSLMIGYRSKAVPVRVLVQYTYRGEEGAAAIQNDSVDAMAQVTF